jgi:4-hydroxy-tetrahydrodipicolinate synthase
MPNRPTEFPLAGIYAAAVTPLTAELGLDLDALPALLAHLAQRGCHGALLMGTTGEGPSFSVAERREVFRAALAWRASTRTDFRIMAGTGCADLPDTIELTRAAFDLGADAVVTLPAFFFKGVSPAGIAAYFLHVLRKAVPGGGRLLAYHFPQAAGVGVPDESIARLREVFPRQFAGMKDSSDDLPHTLATAQKFPGFGVFAGSDSILTEALAGGAVGGITALANITSPLNRAVWDAYARGGAAPEAQAKLNRARQIVKGMNLAQVNKAMLAEVFGFPLWAVRPPLERLSKEQTTKLVEALGELVA